MQAGRQVVTVQMERGHAGGISAGKWKHCWLTVGQGSQRSKVCISLVWGPGSELHHRPGEGCLVGMGGVQELLKRWLSFGCHETQVSVKQADMLEAM